MPQILMPFTVHLDHTLRVTPLNTLFAKGDSAAHRFELTILSAGVPDDLSGCTVLGKFYRMADSTVVSVPGSVEDGKAVVVLDAACYDYIGRFALTISIKKGEEETTVFYGDGYMHGQRADTAISGEYIIYDINTLLEKIAEIDAATQAANTATSNANTATANANAATGKANTAASAANTSAANANSAKDAANAAAAKIDNMTVSATPVSTGTATAALSTVDGHYHLALGLPKGDTGATPQISVQVQTGAAGSEASVSVTGTAEDPVIHLTIPRGDVGDIGALTINGKSPDGSGAVTLTPDDLGAATAEEVSQLKADKLDKTATAADASKLGGVAASDYALKTDTAPDSSKLGGKAPEYYIQPRNLLDNSDFRNPVNQRGQTILETAGAYWLDRWKTSSNGYYDVKDTSIGINSNQSALAGVEQKLANTAHLIGKTLTLAVFARAASNNAEMRLCFPYVGEVTNVPLTSEFEIYTYTTVFQENDAGNSVAVFAETGSSIEVKWAALYEGSYTAETLPPYVPKGYGAELAECQRYYEKINISETSSIGFGYYTSANTECRIMIRYKEKRIAPTITFNFTESGVVCAGKYATINNISSVHSNATYCRLIIFTSEAAIREAAIMYANGSYEVSADL